MKAVSPAESRDLDAATIAAGTPGILLMERAAAAVAHEVARVLRHRPELGARVVALCGAGNNGGDGLEVARRIRRLGPSVETLLIGDPGKLTADAARMFGGLCASGGEVAVVASERDLEPLRSATLVVDALFGTGLSRPIAAGTLAAAAVERCRGAFVVAVDIPSGLGGGSGALDGPHVVANLTVTFGHPKLAHVLLPAAGACGRLVVADIGLLPNDLGSLEVVTASDVAPLFPPRPGEAHKGTYGRLVLVGGSHGMAGAPSLAARAALRAGAGLVTVAAAEEVRPIVHSLVPEATTVGFDDGLASASALGVGPGLGASEASRQAFSRCLAREIPAVFDADALNLAEGRPELFAARQAPTVLTPHPGEAGRLLGRTAADVNADRLGSARLLAKRSGAVVILKGFRSIVASPSGRAATILAGNPGMAKGGSGDVLTGIVGAFLSRGFSAWDAAAAAAWLHGTAGDLAREAGDEEAIVASDLIEALPEAFAVMRAR